MLRAFLLIIASILMLIYSSMGLADPAGDTILVKQLAVAKKSYDAATDELQKTQDEIDKMRGIQSDIENVNDAMHGNYHIDQLFNGQGDMKNRLLTAPGRYSDGLKYLSSGVDSEYTNLQDTYDDAHPMLTELQYRKIEPDGEGYDAYKKGYQQNRAMSVQAQHAYNDAQKDEKKNYKLSHTATPTLKASMDLNNRLQVENNNLKIKLIQLEALKLQQHAGENTEGLDEEAKVAKEEDH